MIIEQGRFALGVNYWASHAGTNMWRDWRPDIVEKDLSALASRGVNSLRVFPLWPDFQPITALLGWGGNLREIAIGEEFPDDFSEEGKAGVDPEYIKRFQAFCSLAGKYGFKLIVPLITGWMSGRNYFPPALAGRNVITDPFCIKWEIRFIKYFVTRFKNESVIAAWELGNECNCMAQANREQAWLWANALADAVKSADNTRRLISGMHSLETGGDCAWAINDQAECCDVLTVHPYPLFTKHCNIEPLVSPRTILHAAAELSMYADIGSRPCLVEEIGSLGGAMGDDEHVARFVRAGLFSAWAHGSPGFFWWCAYDQLHLKHAPYDWCDLERELGMFRAGGGAKPLAEEYKKFSAFLKKLPFEKLPPRRMDAICLLPESGEAWTLAFGAFLAAKRAGFDLRFALKNKAPKDAQFYIIPGGKSLDVLQKRALDVLMQRVEDGATLLITNDDGIPSPFERITGCRSAGRYASDNCRIAFEGKESTFLRSYAINLIPDSAEVVALDSDGKPVFTRRSIGKGNILFLNVPLERCAASVPDAGCTAGYESFYRYAARIAGIRRVVSKSNPGVSITEHALDKNVTLIAAVNNTNEEVVDKLNLNGVILGEKYYGNVKSAGNGAAEVSLEPADAAVFAVLKKRV